MVPSSPLSVFLLPAAIVLLVVLAVLWISHR